MALWKEFLFPKRCPLCDDIIYPIGELCCKNCSPKLEFIGDKFCNKCGKKLADEGEIYCKDCKQYTHSFTRGRSLFEYRKIADSIYRFKESGRIEYAHSYASWMIKEFGEDFKAIQADYIIPVPLSKAKMRKRGYNQAEELGKVLAKDLGIPLRTDLVIRDKNTSPQKQLSRKQRENNLKKAFKITGNDVKLKVVIILDDIYTTGSTADAIAQLLFMQGAKRVYIFTIASGEAQ